MRQSSLLKMGDLNSRINISGYRWAFADSSTGWCFDPPARVGRDLTSGGTTALPACLDECCHGHIQERTKTRREIWQDIAKSPEVAAWMNTNHCSRGELFGAKESIDKDGPISISPGIMTVAQLLDQMAVKSGINYWAVLRSDPAGSCRIETLLW